MTATEPEDCPDVRPSRCMFRRCPDCAQPTHVHPCADGSAVAMQPRKYPADQLPPTIWRHLVHGVVRLGADPREPWHVMIEHAEVCTARSAHDLLSSLRTRPIG
ncbi:DUF6083 domain-containing protein [Streptomyces sp. NPDC050095]|uniref:DUF6083 domain-containing protein n=1 Tax=unclassified Streptomyces TaxID=2593676 RepID=UPI00341331EE